MIAPRPKKEAQSGASFGKGGSTKMHKQQAAGPAKPAITGKAPTAAPGAKRASGGPRTSPAAFLATTAKAGHTSQIRKGK
jgi:hypothetical protein